MAAVEKQDALLAFARTADAIDDVDEGFVAVRFFGMGSECVTIRGYLTVALLEKWRGLLWSLYSNSFHLWIDLTDVFKEEEECIRSLSSGDLFLIVRVCYPNESECPERLRQETERRFSGRMECADRLVRFLLSL